MAVDQDQLSAELRTMRALIEKDSAVRERFDSDGDGDIDGHEWDQVRELVIARLERQDREREAGIRAAAAAGEPSAAEAVVPGAVAQEIYESDLPAAGDAAPRSIADADALILEQQSGVGTAFEGISHACYSVFASDGEPLSSVDQIENATFQGLSHRSPLGIPELDFRVTDAVIGDAWTFIRGQSFGSDQMEVYDAEGDLRAVVNWNITWARRNYVVQPSGEGGSLTIESQRLRPFTLNVIDCVDREIGTIERGWSGLGAFLTGANRTRIRVQPGELEPEQRWGLVAASLLEDLVAGKGD
jgi:hypothetical protein